MTDTAESYGLGVLASDLDLDGDIDVFVANDSNPNFLYRNNGDGTFTEIGAWSGAGLNGNGVAQAGMGVDAADFDGDGRPGHLSSPRSPRTRPRSTTTRATSSSTTSVRRDRPQGDHVRGPEVGLRLPRLRPRRRPRPRDRQRPHLPAGRPGPRAERVVPPASLPAAERQGPAHRRLAAGRARHASRRSRPAGSRSATTTTTATSTCSSRRSTRPRCSSATTRPGSGHWLKLRLLNRHGSPAIGARVDPDGRREVADARTPERLVPPVAERTGAALRARTGGDGRPHRGSLARRREDDPPRRGLRPHDHCPRTVERFSLGRRGDQKKDGKGKRKKGKGNKWKTIRSRGLACSPVPSLWA